MHTLRSLSHWLSFLCAVLSVSACGGDEGGIEPDPAADEAALVRADEAATKLATTLKGRLMEVMMADGPPAAVSVCAMEAQALTSSIMDETGARVGRSSLRLRNPGNKAPSWVADWLTTQGEREAAGVEGVREVVDGPSGRVARVLRPIAVEQGCLNCHGDPAQMMSEVITVLEQSYPNDAATGYAVGDLRGALWVEADVE